MADSDTGDAQRFSRWLRTQLDIREVKTTEVIKRGVAAKAFSKVTFYRWLNGEHPPNSDNARFLAEIFGADPREAYDAAGLNHLMDMEGDVVVATDPVEMFAARVRARGFPKPIEERLIEYIRAEIKARTEAFDELLDTVQDTQRHTPGADDNGD